MRRLTGTGIAAVLLGLAALLSGCGNGDDLVIGVTPTFTATRTAAATGTATRTAVPTVTPTSVQGTSVAGVVVVDKNVGATGEDGVTQLPPGQLPPVSKGFDRGLGGAE